MWKSLFYMSFMVLVWACGPRPKMVPRGSGTEQTPSATDGDVTARTQSTTAPEVPNSPFTMLGGGPNRHHRAQIAGPAHRPVVDATFHTGDRVFASPVVGPDGTIYVGSLDGSFNALKQDGTLRWSFICEDAIFATAAVSRSGLVYIGCDDNTLRGFATDGQLRFTYRITQDMDSSAVIGKDGTVFVGGDGLHALSSGGNRKWKALLGGHVSSAPAIRSDGSVVVGSHDSRVYVFESDGTTRFVYGTGDKVLCTPSVLTGDDVVVGSDSGFVFRLSGEQGGMRWKYSADAPVRGGIAVSADETTLFSAAMNGRVFALDATDGTPVWEVMLGGGVRGAPMLDADGRLYVGSRDNYLYALDSRDGKVVWRIHLFGEVDATVAILVDRRLVVGADNGVLYFLKES